jgi:GNAT superfamily N-acetyltransferase
MKLSPTIQIRKVKENDFPSIQAIKPSRTRESFEKDLAHQRRGDSEFIALEADGDLVCYVILKWYGKMTHPEYPDLEDLYCKESERGKGYATHLIRECEELVKQKGFSKLGMAANIDPECAARKLYAKLGYVPDGGPKYIDGVYNGVEDWCIDLEKKLT